MSRAYTDARDLIRRAVAHLADDSTVTAGIVTATVARMYPPGKGFEFAAAWQAAQQEVLAEKFPRLFGRKRTSAGTGKGTGEFKSGKSEAEPRLF